MEFTSRQWKRSIVAFLFILVLLTVFSRANLSAASTLQDGEYTIDFEILKGDPSDDSTSLANGYWNKPATVIVKNGAISVRTVINKDAWVIDFSTKQGSNFVDSTVLSRNTDNDSRLVEFPVSSFDQDLSAKMTVDIPSMSYYHTYETRFRFYPDTLKLVKAAESEKKDTAEQGAKPTLTPSTSSKADARGDSANTATVKPSATETAGKHNSSQKSSTTNQSEKDTAKPGASENSTDVSKAAAATTHKDAVDAAKDSNAVNEASNSETTTGIDAASALKEQAVDKEESANDSDSIAGQTDANNAESTEAGSEALENTTANKEEMTAVQSANVIQEKQEEQSGSTTLVVLIIIIVIIFLLVSVIWIRKNKGNK